MNEHDLIILSGFSVTSGGACYSLAATVTNVWIAPTTDYTGIPSSLQLTTLTATDTNPLYVNAWGMIVLWESTDTEILALLSSISATTQPSSPSNSAAIAAPF